MFNIPKFQELRELELQNKFRGLVISTLVVILIIALILSTCLR